MDILNFISWIRGRRQVTSVDPAKTLLPVGIKDPKRDDEYIAGAITVEDFAASIVTPPAYKVYTALLTQTGIDAPVATVLENTLGTNITYQYNGIGNYSILASNDLFTANKTYSVLQLWADDGISPRLGFIGRASTSELYMTLTDTNGNTVDTLGDNQNPVYFLTSIEIRVYN
jgi:hypothetical protein